MWTAGTIATNRNPERARLPQAIAIAPPPCAAMLTATAVKVSSPMARATESQPNRRLRTRILSGTIGGPIDERRKDQHRQKLREPRRA